METILNYGIAFIVWFQGFGSWLVEPMKFFSFLGSETFIMVLIPLIYWCVDAPLGLRIAVIVLFSGGINEIAKLALYGPRPYWFTTQVKAYAAESNFGVPSGHSQSAVALWGTAASIIKHRWLWLLAFFFILMIGLSRLFLAVHFPHDVLAGWAIGGLLVWGYLKCWQPAVSWLEGKSLGQQIGLAFALSLIMIVLGSIAYGSLHTWVMPAAWLENARLAGVDVLPAPVSLKNTISFAAALFGFLSGVAWTNSRGGYNASGNTNRKMLRFLLGLVGLLVFYIGVGKITPAGENLASFLGHYLRYALVGLWISAGAPWLFQKLNLLQRKNT